jgi:hypothetical protein
MSQNSDGLLWGVQSIGNYIFRGSSIKPEQKKRRAQYLIDTKRVRVRHVGPKLICARTDQLDEDLSAEIPT